jgi:Tfp pilus assembly protein PilN
MIRAGVTSAGPAGKYAEESLIFQESLGISIGDHQIALVYLKGTLRGIRCVASSILSLEKDVHVDRKLHAAGLAVAEFMRENRIGSPSIYVGLPAAAAMFREIEFPAAVRQSLGTTLTYELEKYIPISIDEIYFDYHVAGPAGENRIAVLLMVVKRIDLDHYLDFCRGISGGVNGIEIASTALSNSLLHFSGGKSTRDLGDDFLMLLKGAGPSETSHAEHADRLMKTFDLTSEALLPAFGLALKGMRSVAVDINLLPTEYRRRPNRTGYYTMMVLAVLVLVSFSAWAGSYWVHRNMVSRALNAELVRLTSEMAGIQKTQARIDRIDRQLSELNALNERYTPVSDILRELTQVLPETAWVREFQLDDGKIRLQGYADSASELISLLEASPFFRDVYFTSAIVKEKDGRERFHISLEMEPS